MGEADTDASDVASSADPQPIGTPSGKVGNAPREPPVEAAALEGSGAENRTPETGDQGREILPASAVGGRAIAGNRRRFLRVDNNAICRYYMRHNGKRTASRGGGIRGRANPGSSSFQRS
jgi:hypothetical protein